MNREPAYSQEKTDYKFLFEFRLFQEIDRVLLLLLFIRTVGSDSLRLLLKTQQN